MSSTTKASTHTWTEGDMAALYAAAKLDGEEVKRLRELNRKMLEALTEILGSIEAKDEIERRALRQAEAAIKKAKRGQP